MKIEEKFPLIDSYLTGRISDEENQELTELRKQTEFEEEFKFRQEAFITAKQLGRESLKERLKNLDQPTKVVRFRNWWALAAAMILLLLAVPFLFNQPSAQDLYAENYQPFTNVLAPINRSADEKSDLHPAFIHYQRGEYSEAREEFQDLEKKFPAVAIYIGVTYLEEDNFDTAISVLEPISKDENARFQNEATWYLGMAYLAKSDEEKAISVLKKISSEDHAFQDRAQKLLNELDN